MRPTIVKGGAPRCNHGGSEGARQAVCALRFGYFWAFERPAPQYPGPRIEPPKRASSPGTTIMLSAVDVVRPVRITSAMGA